MGAAAPLFTASFFARPPIHHTKAFYYNRFMVVIAPQKTCKNTHLSAHNKFSQL